MNTIRILHVDDEPDIREVVGMSLGLNADFDVRACVCGGDAVATAAEWSPFLILLDVMMPGMDGPSTLAQLRKNPRTHDIPVLFMTARAQTTEVEHFISLGAQGVISKPFDPMTLAKQVSGHFEAVDLESLRGVFARRARSDAVMLATMRSVMDDRGRGDLGRIKDLSNGLGGAAALFGYDAISRDAKVLEGALSAPLDGSGKASDVKLALDNLLLSLASVTEQPSFVA
jgi:CheY-like chemotaxis protein